MILICPEFKLLKNYDKFVRRELDSTKELTYLFCYDIENHITKDLYIFNQDKNINEFLKEYDLITKMKIKYILIKNKFTKLTKFTSE